MQPPARIPYFLARHGSGGLRSAPELEHGADACHATDAMAMAKRDSGCGRPPILPIVWMAAVWWCLSRAIWMAGDQSASGFLHRGPEPMPWGCKRRRYFESHLDKACHR